MRCLNKAKLASLVIKCVMTWRASAASTTCVKAVGLLGAAKGRAKPVAFAEDTCVPPENLADFIVEFRELLDAKQLNYGMFGHVDAGVLHVRPALDLCDPQQEALMHEVSDEVVKLVAKYGGLMWVNTVKATDLSTGLSFWRRTVY